MTQFNYSAPEFVLSGSSASPARDMPSVLFVLKNHRAGPEWEKSLPKHLADHAAWKGDLGARLSLHGHDAPHIFFGLGEFQALDAQEASEHAEAFGRYLLQQQIETARLFFPAPLLATESLPLLMGILKGLGLANFKITEFRTKNEPGPRLRKLEIALPAGSALSEAHLAILRATIQGVTFARHLIELPAHDGGPSDIAARFKASIDPKIIHLEIWDEKRIAKEKMGLLLAVGRGSEHPPRFLVARYGKEYAGKKPTLALVGKGVTFDTGGINLKTGEWRGLVEMKKDMGGAAAVLGTMLVLQKLKPKVSVIGITPLTYNCIDAKATLPSDVAMSRAGKTVEILNTDAEGRLILADALDYAVEQKPDYLVDIATLTGACVVALGNHLTGCFSNHKEFQAQLMKTSGDAGEPTWPLPVSARYGAELKSEIADLANMGKARDGGASLAAAFLQKFVAETPWVHLDIAGTVDLGAPAREGAQTVGAGRMVHTLSAFALKLAQGEVGFPTSSSPSPSLKKQKK